MKRWGLALAIAAVLLAGACHEAADNGDEDRPPGAMSYAGYDDLGRLVVVGWIRLDIVTIQQHGGPPTPMDFNGDWHLHALADTGRIGPQDGAGSLAGTFLEDGIAVDLFPGGNDNNVRLLGKLTAGGGAPMRFEGTWQWETLLGLRAQGTFRASQ